MTTKPDTLEPRYKILPDEVQPNKFRVVYVDSEYTVSYKKQLQHGLTKRAAMKMVALLESKRANAIHRLLAAVNEFNSLNPAPKQQTSVINDLSVKHRIGVKSIRTALSYQSGSLK